MSYTVLNDCCLTALRNLPAASVDCVVTSPPYWGLRDYGVPPTDWPAVTYCPMPGVECEVAIAAETSCLGLEPTLSAFIGHLVLIFREVHRVLKPSGTCWVNMGDGYAGSWGSQGRANAATAVSTMSARQVAASARKQGKTGSTEQYPGLKPKDLQGQPWRVAFALQAEGWWLRQDLIWSKKNPMPESITDRATKSHEYLFLLTKSDKYFFDQQAWLEPASEGTHARVSQNLAAQIGSERANGGTRAERPMKAVVRGGNRFPSGWDSTPGDHCTLKHNSGPKSRKEASALSASPREPSQQVGVRRWATATDAERGVKNNTSMDAALTVMPLRRNKRSVWSLGTYGYDGAHYATYPPELVRPCILAGSSARGCCPQCGTPWQRKRVKTDVPDPKNLNSQFHTGKTGARPTKGGEPCQKTERTLNVAGDWQPGCACGRPDTVPAVILDPFAGSGTTGQVAIEEGRAATLIEVGPHNVKLIHDRLGNLTPRLPLH